MLFTDEQLKAIDIQKLGQDACIVAGPGSGKTTVLVERYRQLVASGIQPSEILAITFTEKAAANMRSRLSKEFAGNAELLQQLERANVSTIHGFCSRLLRDNATDAGVDPEFTVLDEQLAVLEQARSLRETLDAMVVEDAQAIGRLLTATDGADLEASLPGIYDAVRAAGVRPQELRNVPTPKPPKLEGILARAKRYVNGFPAKPNPAQNNAKANANDWVDQVVAARELMERFRLLSNTTKPFELRTTNSAKDEVKLMREEATAYSADLLDEIHKPQKELLIRIFENFDDLYRSRKAALAALDFNDLEFFAVRLLEENPEIRRGVNAHFRLVMIDEFQDTSAQQSRLVNLVRGPGRFYAVGDLNQSIYSFRHASPKVFTAYRETVQAGNAHHQELVENWRSREPVLLATQTILNGAPGIAQRDLLPARRLPARSQPCVEVLVSERQAEHGEYQLEAAWVVERILHLRDTLRLDEEQRAAKLSDFAILVRNTQVLEPYLQALDAAGIDYSLNRRSGFFETREARDLIHLLRMILNPRDEVSTLAILRSDLAGISEEGLLRLKTPRRTFAEGFEQIDSASLGPEDELRLRRFLAAFAKWRAAAPQISIDRLVLRALDDMGVAWEAQSARGANIEKFLRIARSYEHMTLGEFVAHTDSMRTADPRETDAPIDETRDAVQIMSTHAAKGLEFPIVILAAMDKGVDTARSPVLNFTPEFGLGVKWALSDGDETCSGHVHLLNKKSLNQTEEEEANRLLYVALTRAQEHLILAWSQEEKAPGNWAATVLKSLALIGDPASGEAVVKNYLAPNGRAFDVRFLRTADFPPPFLTASSAQIFSDTEVLPQPLLTSQFEPNTTATALSQFASCPRKYYLSSFLGWNGLLVHPRAQAAGSVSSFRASDIGTQVHQLLAETPPEAPDLEAIRLAQVFESSSIGRRSFRARHRETEWDFVFALDALILRGTIDLWFEDEQGLTLVDYKTDSVTPENASERALDYALQLQVYALAMERAAGKKPDRAWLHFLRPDVAVPVPLGDAEGTVSRVAAELKQAQETLTFPLHVAPHCRRCEFFRNLCPAR